MTFLDELDDDAVWDAFLAEKEADRYMDGSELQRLRIFISMRSYKRITSALRQGGYTFSPPVRKRYLKSHSASKMRTVYSFGEDENIVLKVATFVLRKYDGLFAPNLLSYRKGRSISDAVRMLKRCGAHGKYTYKADIHDYFNSVDAGDVIRDLEKGIDDPTVAKFFGSILRSQVIIERKEPIAPGHAARGKGTYVKVYENSPPCGNGIMAGLPTSSFLANFVLRKMDWEFHEAGIPYARYSDDLIVVTDSEEERDRAEEFIDRFLSSKGLIINEDKRRYTSPGDMVTFLGLCFTDRGVGIDPDKLESMFARIRYKRKIFMRAYRKRLYLGGEDDVESQVRNMIGYFNRKFFTRQEGEVAWAAWYIPYLSYPDDLRAVDRRLQEALRSMLAGGHHRMNSARIPYSELGLLGYERTLVREYYDQRKRLNAESASYHPQDGLEAEADSSP